MFGRIQFKISLSYLVVIVAMLVLLNTYPLYVSQSFVFGSKHSSMLTKANVLASSLAGLENLTGDGVARVMMVLEISGLERVIVTNEEGLSLYDNAAGDSTFGKYILLPEVFGALSGNDVFRSRFSENAFDSSMAIPIISKGGMIGAVCLYEQDSEQAALLRGIQTNMMNISILISAIVILASFILSSLLSRRIRILLRAIQTVREGKYGHRCDVPGGSDELAELAAEFNELAGRLQETETVRRRFVSDASHELKTPLASVRLLADSIIQTENMSNDVVREFVTDIGDEIDRLTRISEKLLVLTRLDSESGEEFSEVDVKLSVLRAAHMLEPLASHCGVVVGCGLEDGCHILGDEDGMYQIVFNLMENAIKYNRPGGEVWVELSAKGDSVVLAFNDTGIGIPEEDRPRVFERFYRVDKARSREQGGTGLGLSIVSDEVERFGGEIRIEDKDAPGTRFYIEFPRFTSDDRQVNGSDA